MILNAKKLIGLFLKNLNKILLTGSTGFLGSILRTHLNKNDVLTLNRSNSTFNYDIHNTIPVFDQLFNIVIHSAGKAHSVPKNLIEQNDFYEINYIGTKNLLNALTNNPPEKFVFISSVAVYGKYIGENILETSDLLATDAYGDSKKQAEYTVIEWCRKYKVKYTILRLPLLIGPNAPGNLKSMINGIKRGYYFNIDGGMARKSMVLADDVAKYIFKAAEVGGIYNLTDGYHPSFVELSNCISNQFGKGKSMNIPFWLASIIAMFGDLLGTKAPLNTNKLKKITSDLTFDDSKAREAFGWNPTPVLEGFKINLL